MSPDWAAPLTGIAADDIVRIAHELAAAEAGICYGRMGVSTQAYGALCQWAIQVINVATGHLDKPGAVCSRVRRWIRWSIPTPAVLAALPPWAGPARV
ncbi:MAG: hypothetical protein CM15mP103_04460 [Gammaproteobacteria bacterium]|nr:MAG: hypothetical protein CM15mP103_04460 [Gammaproteobacteria bacterium]